MDEIELINELSRYVKKEMEEDSNVSFEDVMDYITGEVKRIVNT